MNFVLSAATCLAAVLSCGAQNNVPRAVSTNPLPTTNPASSSGSSPAAGTTSGSGTSSTGPSPAGITGVPRYHAGFRGPSDSPAAVTSGEISRVGDDGAINPASALLPIASFRNNSLGIAPGTPITVRLLESVDSGHVRNGEVIHATLVKPVAGVPAGSKVELSVVSSAAAGRMKSSGELSVQITRINGVDVLSQVITAEGEEGKRLTPDAAPARGTEAQLGPDQPLVLPAA